MRNALPHSVGVASFIHSFPQLTDVLDKRVRLRFTPLEDFLNPTSSANIVKRARMRNIATSSGVCFANSRARGTAARRSAIDALITRGYLAADEPEDAEAVQAAFQAFLADGLSGGCLH
jgi:hypothetical protein